MEDRDTDEGEFALLKIKVCADYCKLDDVEARDGDVALLSGAARIRLEDLPPDFIEYDTRMRNGAHYNLPKKGDFILLKFTLANPTKVFSVQRCWHNPKTGIQVTLNGDQFSTLRRYTPTKWPYYLRNTSKKFRVTIEKKEG